MIGHQAKTEAKKKFPCVGCGGCCSSIGEVPKEDLDSYGLTAKEDGSCIHLTEDRKCSIYDSRPEICKISFHKHAIKHGMNPESSKHKAIYYAATAFQCNKYIDKQKLDYPKIDYLQIASEYLSYD